MNDSSFSERSMARCSASRAAAQRLRDRPAHDGILGIPLRDGCAEPHRGRIGVGGGQAAYLSVIVDYVDHTPVRQRRYRELGHSAQRQLELERHGELGAGCRHELGRLFGPPAFGDVSKDGDRKVRLPLSVENGRRADQRPTLLAGGHDPEPHQHFGYCPGV
jgi:hypothetical protein